MWQEAGSLLHVKNGGICRDSHASHHIGSRHRINLTDTLLIVLGYRLGPMRKTKTGDGHERPALNPYSFDLFQARSIRSAVVELGCSYRLVIRDVHGMFHGTAVLKVGRDAGRSHRMTAHT